MSNPIFGVPEDDFGARDDLPAAFGVIPVVADTKEDYAKQDARYEGSLVEAGAFWLPGASPTVTRLGLRPKAAGAGIAGAASVFTIEQDFYRSTATENTDGDVDGVIGASVDRRAGYEMWQASPLLTLWQINARGQAAFGDDVPSATQTAFMSLSSGEPGSIPGSGTDGYWQLILGSSNDGLAVELKIQRWNGTQYMVSQYLVNPYVGAIAYKSASVSIANNTTTTVTYNSESEDTNGFHDTGANTERLTIPTGMGGVYIVRSVANWNAGSTGRRQIEIFLNGTVTRLAHGQHGAPGTITGASVDTEVTVRLVPTDFVITRVTQGQGAALDLLGGSDLTRFEIKLAGV